MRPGPLSRRLKLSHRTYVALGRLAARDSNITFVSYMKLTFFLKSCSWHRTRTSAEEHHPALLFAASCEGRVTRSMAPHMFTDYHHHLAQEVAAEFCVGFPLDNTCSQPLSNFSTGLMLRRDRCASCGHAHEPIAVEHHSLELTFEIDHDDDDGILLLHNVWSALSAYLPGETVQRDDPCSGCGQRNQTHTRQLEPLAAHPILPVCP